MGAPSCAFAGIAIYSPITIYVSTSRIVTSIKIDKPWNPAIFTMRTPAVLTVGAVNRVMFRVYPRLLAFPATTILPITILTLMDCDNFTIAQRTNIVLVDLPRPSASHHLSHHSRLSMRFFSHSFGLSRLHNTMPTILNSLWLHSGENVNHFILGQNNFITHHPCSRGRESPCNSIRHHQTCRGRYNTQRHGRYVSSYSPYTSHTPPSLRP